MKMNIFKVISMVICCLVASLWSENKINAMEGSRINYENYDEPRYSIRMGPTRITTVQEPCLLRRVFLGEQTTTTIQETGTVCIDTRVN